MRFVLLGLLLVLNVGCATPPKPSEVCEVIIGASNYGYVGAQIVGGNNGGATLLSDNFDNLFDGQPSTLTRFQYVTSGSQTTSSFFGIEVFITNQGDPTPITADWGLLAILHTSLPAGALVEAWEGTPGAGTLRATLTMQPDPDGNTTSAWMIVQNVSNHGTAITAVFRNNLNSSTYLTNGTEVTIGEMFISDTVTVNLKRDPSWTPVNTAKIRYSAANVQWPVLQPMVRLWTYNFAPVTQDDAFIGGGSFMRLIASIMAGPVAAFIPFESRDLGFYGIANVLFDTIGSSQLRSATAILGQFGQQQPTSKYDGEYYVDTTMQVQESI